MKLKTRFLLLIAVIFLLLTALILYVRSEVVLTAQSYVTSVLIDHQIALDRQLLITPLQRDIETAKKMASDPDIIRMVLNDKTPAFQADGIAAMEKFRVLFEDHSVFIAFADNYYFKDAPGMPVRHALSSKNTADNWFYDALASVASPQLNVDNSFDLKKQRIWINVPIQYKDKIIGIVGTGISMSNLVAQSVDFNQISTQNFIFDNELVIQLHHLSSEKYYRMVQVGPEKISINRYFSGQEDLGRLRSSLQQARQNPNTISKFSIQFQGRSSLIGISYLPEIGWYDLVEINPEIVLPAEFNLHRVVLILLVILLTFVLIGYSINRWIIEPINALKRFVSLIKAGDFSMPFDHDSPGEFKGLSKSFAEMASSIASNNLVLENKVCERTEALEASIREKKRLLSEHQQLKFVLDKHAIVSITDQRGIILQANDNFFKISGYSRDELIGNDHRLLNSGHHPSGFFKNMYKTIIAGGIWHDEVCNRAKDGSLYWVDATVAAFYNDDGKPKKYIAVRTDITQRRLSEELAVQANAAKSLFLSNMSHEIRTPMNAIIGFNALSLRTEQNEKQRDYALKIRSASESLLGIINQVLDISKIEAGKIELECVPFTIEHILNELHTLEDARAADKELKIMFDIEPDILAANFRGDPLRLKQILLNLINNAIKFSARGIIKLSCKIKTRIGESVCLLFSVQDQGIGLSVEQISLLFKPFSQADSSTTRQYGGTGLGLSICKSLVEKLGGQIWIESEPDKGSTFLFTANLLIHEGVLAAPVDETAVYAKLEQDMARLAGAHVLIVEDNLFNQQVLSELLSEHGLIVDIANNGLEAVSQVKKLTYDIVLMDIQMPVMDGYTACEKIRSDPQFASLPIVGVTGNVLQSEKERCEQVGMNDYLVKPVDTALLYASLLRFIPAVRSSQVPVADGLGLSADEIPAFPGINMAPALKRMRGNTARYLKIHALFCQQFHAAATPLQHALNAGDYDTAGRLAHTLKGAASTIGAEQLREVTAKLEQACQQQNPDYAVLLAELENALKIVIV